MKNEVDYSQYECPYSHLKKECGHELKGPKGYQDVYSVWCGCGFRGPVFYLNPEELKLKKKGSEKEIKFLMGLFKEGGENYYIEVLKGEDEIAKKLNEEGYIKLNNEFADECFAVAKLTKKGMERLCNYMEVV
jgi:hypothetical protein